MLMAVSYAVISPSLMSQKPRVRDSTETFSRKLDEFCPRMLNGARTLILFTPLILLDVAHWVFNIKQHWFR